MQNVSQSNSKLRVVLIEDSAEVLGLLTEMLNEIPNVEIVASAQSEASGLKALQKMQPDVAIIDLELGLGNGLNVLKIWFEDSKRNHDVKIVVFSNYANLVIQKRCLFHGALAFFDKSFQLEELLDFVHTEAARKQSS